MNKNISESKIILMKLFIRFLKERGVFKKFTTNYYEYWKIKGYSRTLCEYLENKHSPYFLTGAFGWQNSNEGHKFWSNLSDEWLVIRNRILKKIKFTDE